MKLKQPKTRFKNVLLLDDSELDNFINEKTIEANHFAQNIYVHTSGKSALEFLKNLTVMGNEYKQVFPSVLFVDLNMPMMDGFQFLEQLKADVALSSIAPQIVILTSSVYHEDRERAAAISPDIIFLNKPLTQKMLEEL